MRCIKFITKYFEEILCFVLFVSMTVLIGAQVLLRSIGSPLSWTEEIARYMFVTSIYIGCALGVKKRRHLKIDAVYLLFKTNGQFFLKVTSNFLFAVWTVILGYYGFQLLMNMTFGVVHKAPATGLAMAIPYGMVVLGLLLTLLRLAIDTFDLFKERKIKKQLKEGV